MTKKELIEKLELFPDDTTIILITYQNMGYTVYTSYEEAVDVIWVEPEGKSLKGVAII